MPRGGVGVARQATSSASDAVIMLANRWSPMGLAVYIFILFYFIYILFYFIFYFVLYLYHKHVALVIVNKLIWFEDHTIDFTNQINLFTNTFSLIKNNILRFKWLSSSGWQWWWPGNAYVGMFQGLPPCSEWRCFGENPKFVQTFWVKFRQQRAVYWCCDKVNKMYYYLG